jgi:hypothetical protein
VYRVGVVGCFIVMVWILSGCASTTQSAPLSVVLPAPTDRFMTATSTVATATVTPTATMTATSRIRTFSQLTLPPTFTPTFTITNTAIPMTDTPTFTPSPTATFTPTVTPSPTITNTPPAYISETPFTWQSGSLYAEITNDESLRALNGAPVLYLPVDHVRRIYRRGVERNLNSDFLLNVGDCNTENVNYLEPLTYLDDTSESITVNLSTIETYAESFRFKGQSVNSGLNALGVMDAFWANSNSCYSGESPLACDVRTTQPFAAVVMFGANDLNVLTVQGYETAMRDIIQFLLEREVIPILSTFTVRDDVGDMRYDTAIRFNGVLVRLAGEYEIPLINFWREAQLLPDRGIFTDNAHLSEDGFELRNRLTLEMLAAIQTEIIEVENAE